MKTKKNKKTPQERIAERKLYYQGLLDYIEAHQDEAHEIIANHIIKLAKTKKGRERIKEIGLGELLESL